MTRRHKTFEQFSSSQSGTIFVKFALMLPCMLCVSLAAMDFAWTHTHKSVLQDAADLSALAGAKELSLSDSNKGSVSAAVEAMVKRFIETNRGSLVKKSASAPMVRASIGGDPLEVEVNITQKVDALVGGKLGLEFPDLKIRSVARVIGQPNICVLALDPSANRALSLEHKARVTGRNCAVYSNSSHANAIIAKNSANMTATFICSRGGKSGGPGSFSPTPMTDCPGFDDPLSGRGEPMVGSCLEDDLVINGGARTLFPGTYCGGVHVTNNASVSLESGVYVFKGGPFKVDRGARVSGKGVGLYFNGEDAALEFAHESSISLTALKTGEMAGLLIFSSRTQDEDTTHELYSNDAPVLLGTIYIPNGELRVDADAPIAQDSAYTAIVARTMRLYGGPHLILNTNYEKTDVPVPEGIKGAGQPVALVE